MRNKLSRTIFFLLLSVLIFATPVMATTVVTGGATKTSATPIYKLTESVHVGHAGSWFKIVPKQTEIYTFTLTGTGNVVNLAVYNALFTQNSSLSGGAVGDKTVSISCTAGNPYYILVSMTSPSTPGPETLTISGDTIRGVILSADTTSNDVTSDLDITFESDGNYESAVSSVSFDGTLLTNDTDYTVSSGKITLKPSGGKPCLQTVGTGTVLVTATGYEDSSVSQTINPGPAHSLEITQAVTAPASNGGVFVQQPKVTLKDLYGNICTNDNATVITTSRFDDGNWTLTGTTTATANSGVATFVNLGATNGAVVAGAQLGFDTGALSQVISSAISLPAPAPTYTMTAITNQTLTTKTVGYGADTQETKTLTITRTGTGDLNGLATALSGANPGSFTITQPTVTTLNDGIPNTTFTIKANDGLAVGTYFATVTISSTNMTDETFTVTQVVNATSGGGSGGGSGSNRTTSSTTSPAVKILNDITTPDEYKLEISLQKNGEARIELISTGNGQATITGNILNQLSELQKPLNIVGQGVNLQFATDSLKTSQITGQNNNSTVQIGAEAVTNTEKDAIMAATLMGESTGIFQVGGQVFSFTAQLSTSSDGKTSSEKITSFAEPVAVTIDLSGLTLTSEQISQLTGTRLEKNEQGEIVPEFLGGTYDEANKTFTFYTDKFSLYTVLQKNEIVILNLTIGNAITKLNGEEKTIDVPPSLINNRTYVPLRFIGEALGASFDWNDKTKTVTFHRDDQEIALTVGETIPGMDTPPTIVNGRTMVPLRYISETFGAQVMWFPASQSVSVVK
ncbi:stalk domain-containing protein [Petrocella sp. FN5]|uniref:stalk domain-containing protein n=1 Tax=Petrocella sp. FN5 TaxID=3032002 RepID=UPI0023DBB47E|nr:stalk domain-containing protein [Petrocella sp. FN5]MDF1618659.1 stalk domain-containing protein [Petrocella sp. FN5]